MGYLGFSCCRQCGNSKAFFADAKHHHVDTGNVLMSDGEPNPDNDVSDRLHLSAYGCDISAYIM